MKHHDAIEWLPDLAEDCLGAPTEAEVKAHVAGCGECQDWLQTYRLVAQTLSRREVAAAHAHPSADRLARHAVGSGLVDEVEHLELAMHLHACNVCRAAVTLGRAAVAASDKTTGGAASPPRLRAAAGRFRPWRLPLAAGLVLGLLALPFLLRPRPRDQEISGEYFLSNRVITAGRSISASDTTIGAGAEVTFRVGEAVILGERRILGGFRCCLQRRAAGLKARTALSPCRAGPAGGSGVLTPSARCGATSRRLRTDLHPWRRR